MPTRLKRPAIWRPLALTAALLGFQGYLGFSAIGGQFGWENRAQILLDIDQLKGKSAALQAEIDAYRHRATLMDTRRLDPDIITERARAMLNMAHADDIIVMDAPGVLATVAGILSDGGVSVATVVQTVEGEDEPTARLIIGTHRATEQALSATVDALADSAVVARVISVLRVEGE